MNNWTLTCQNEQRRHQVRRQRRNGLDYLEVGDDVRSLYVYFLRSVPEHLRKENVQIAGGQHIRNIQVKSLEVESPQNTEAYLKVNVDQQGDFSLYTLRLVALDEQDRPTNQPHPDFDPRYAQLQFRFRAGDCSSDLDCLQQKTCPPPQLVEPDINYLAKDYASFRQLILDRLSLIMPDWQERHVPDLGITLVELLAYVGDHLSYYQDAVATEAYLDTARQRISVRRHVRLVDYPMHEGCNARTWVWLKTNDDVPLEGKDFYFITSYEDAPAPGTILKGDEDLDDIPPQNYEVFEPLTPLPIHLYVAHNEISFYTWGDRSCCIPRGATSATLLDEWIPATEESRDADGYGGIEAEMTHSLEPKRKLHLEAGDILIFEEIKGAKTGNPQDADVKHRHAVRLTQVKPSVDELYNLPIVEIDWAKEDALPFPLCISAIEPAPECGLIENISVARGNVLLVDHGRTIEREDLGIVPEKETRQECIAEGEPAEIRVVPDRFRPSLQKTPLTFRQPLCIKTQDPATSLLTQDPREAFPQIELTGTRIAYGTVEDCTWTPQHDLIDSNAEDRHFVVEMSDRGQANLRFGDGELGQIPAVETHFRATYRIGNGLSGNLGAGKISYIVFHKTRHDGWTLQPHQPLPVTGGIPPEPLSEVKLFAPHLFHQKLERAITADDYAQLVMQDFPTKVQRAAATLHWTGSWYKVLVVIDPLGQDVADPKLLKDIETRLNLYRRIGHDLEVKGAVRVSLDIAMRVLVKCNYLRGHVKAALLDMFSDRILPDGRCGFFHPDNLTFGKGIALSQLVAIAHAVPGVESVTLTKLERLFEGSNGEIETGFLPISSLEIARLDNNPNFPENGQLTLDMRGGR